MRASEEIELEQAMLEDKLRATDWEATSEAIEEQVARESYLHWLRDNEMRSRKKSRTATATSSSSLSPLAEGGVASASSSPRGGATGIGGGAGRTSPRSRASPRASHTQQQQETAMVASGAKSPPEKGGAPSKLLFVQFLRRRIMANEVVLSSLCNCRWHQCFSVVLEQLSA